MDYIKIEKATHELLNTLSETNLTYAESIEVLNTLSKALTTAIYRQADIEVSLISKQLKNTYGVKEI